MSRGVPTPCDVLAILAAVYDVEQATERWFANLLSAVSSAADLGAGVGSVLYDTSEARLSVDAIECVGAPSGWRDAGLAMHQDPDLVPQMIIAYRSLLCATLSQLNRRVKGRLQRSYESHEVGGQIMVNGLDCSGKGCALFLFSPRPVWLTEGQRDFFARLATHIATGYRLHRQAVADRAAYLSNVEAILTPAGRVQQAALPARGNEGLRALQGAVRVREQTRTLGLADFHRALRSSRGLVDARWTLVDHYEEDGTRYVLARENAPKPTGGVALSQRERQVVALAALGRTNKIIAYELGLAHSTIRVLMARAAAKLEATGRRELIARHLSIAARG